MSQMNREPGRKRPLTYRVPANVLLEALVQRELIPAQDSAPLLEAARVTGRSVCALLLARGSLDESLLAETLVYACDLPYINLDEYVVDLDVLHLLDSELCWQRRVLPLDRVGATLMLAMVDPLDDMAATRLAAEIGLGICRAVVIASQMERALVRHFPRQIRPEETFGPTEATQAIEQARDALAAATTSPPPPPAAPESTDPFLPDWLSGTDVEAAAGADGLSSLPNWLDEEPLATSQPAATPPPPATPAQPERETPAASKPTPSPTKPGAKKRQTRKAQFDVPRKKKGRKS